jgi:putative phosphotransacetylase
MMKEIKVPIEVSARHLHLTQKDVDILFGVGYQLMNKRELSQKGYYVAEERVEVIGKKASASFGILTPLRSQTQVEMAITDAIKLGIDVYVRLSGDLVGSAGCMLKGPAGELMLEEGVIVAKRHIHINDKLAKEYGISDHDEVSVKIEGNRGVVFEHVVVRTDPTFDITMHIDTDEGNAIHVNNRNLSYGVIKKMK